MTGTPLGTRVKLAFASALALGAAAVSINSIGCDNGSTTTAFTTDPFVYYTYYPADVSVASYYWANDWVYTSLYILAPNADYGAASGSKTATENNNGSGSTGPSSGAAGSPQTSITGGAGAMMTTSGAAGSTGATPTVNPPVTTVADAVRALARGEDVCGGAAVVTAKTRSPVCTGAPAQARAGVTIVFNGCQTAGGGTISGTIDVASTASASSTACTGATQVTLSHTTTITNLTYVAPNGYKAVIPQQTDTGRNTFTFGQAPPTITYATSGRLQTYGPDGVLLSDTNFSGTPTISFAGATSSYTIDGTFDTMDNRLNGAGSTYTLTALTRAASCCRPVSGTVRASHGAGTTRTYAFGPTCGDLTLDGQILTTLPACL